MELEYYHGKKKISWSTMTLLEFTQIYTPPGWEDLFEAVEDDIIPDLSKDIQRYAKNNVIYPPLPLVFNALDALQPSEIKVVVIGMDPYINPGEAMGWSFSVPEGAKLPPSLRNIYKELSNEGYKGYNNLKSGDLTKWVDKGVFLYNVCLTVNKGDSGSHKKIWSEFTDTVISLLNQCDHIAWVLLGATAKAYSKKLDRERHGIFVAGHPSPLNRNGGFFNSGVFKDAEKYLKKHKRKFTWNL